MSRYLDIFGYPIIEYEHLSFDKYKCPLVRQLRPVCISQSVKPLHLLRIPDPILRHIPHHLASGHLGIHAFLHDLLPGKFTEDAGDIHILRLQIFLNTAGIFF